MSTLKEQYALGMDQYPKTLNKENRYLEQS